MRITDVNVFAVQGRGILDAAPWKERSARPLDAYAEFAGETPGRVEQEQEQEQEQETVRHVYVEILTDDGPTGLYGPIMAEQAFVIHTQLRPFLIGRDPLAGGALWDQMVRANRHGRAGHYMMAVSAVDCALWDLRGRHFGAPVCQLLGGPTRDRIRCYASMLGHSLEPDRVRARALETRDRGFTAQKWFFRHGPAAGAEGRARNLELVRTLREALGEGYDLMFDCFMGWDLPYAIRMARDMMPFGPKWLEEPLAPNHVDGFARLKRETGIPLATGEHLYTRWDVRPFLDAGALDYVQADPDWCGGITELVRICALAETYDVQVVPHGHSVMAASHVIASQPPSVCPMQEYLLQHVPRKHFFRADPPVPAGGCLPLPERPGLGIELDEGKVESREDLTWS